jgi:hypothetical protein
MAEQENPLIRITEDDIKEANQLSLHCPICAGAVEDNPQEDALTPVVCAECGTLYHKACWGQSGGKCAILGCDETKYYVHGRRVSPVLTISHKDIPRQLANGSRPPTAPRTKELKAEQARQVEQLRRPGLLRRLFQWLLDQIKIG